MECALCKRETPAEYLQGHHLIPKARGGRCRIKLCCDCHGQIHQIFKPKELEVFSSVGMLLAHEKVYEFVEWVKTKKRFGLCMARKKKRG